MKQLSFVLLAAVICCASAAEKGLPDYIKACSQNDPQIDECTRKNAELSLPAVLKGDKSRKIPVLAPYNLPQIKIDQGSSFKLTLSNCVVHGLDTITFEKAHVDFEKRTFEFKGVATKVNILSDYEIDGRILVLPIVGKGPANLTFVDCNYDYELKYDLVKKEDGKEYLQIKSTTLTFTPKRSWYKLANLFNGDARLATEMQAFLDESWREMDKDLNPVLAETVKAVITDILSKIVTRIPFENVFTV